MEPHPLPIEPQGLLEGISWRAVLFGAIVDTALTVFAFAILMLWVAGSDAFSPDEDVADRAIGGAVLSPEFLLCGLVVGVLATVIGAYVGARRAGIFHIRHGGWIAVCSALISLLFLLVPGANSEPTPPLWYDAVGFFLILPAGLLGGLLAALRDRATAA
jgi:hypothetical protein